MSLRRTTTSPWTRTSQPPQPPPLPPQQQQQLPRRDWSRTQIFTQPHSLLSQEYNLWENRIYIYGSFIVCFIIPCRFPVYHCTQSTKAHLFYWYSLYESFNGNCKHITKTQFLCFQQKPIHISSVYWLTHWLICHALRNLAKLQKSYSERTLTRFQLLIMQTEI